MKIRAISNGNIYDLSEADAIAHIATGLFEKVEEPKKEAEEEAEEKPSGKGYKRRDMKADK